jgi:small conductance mechanosensitive channel
VGIFGLAVGFASQSLIKDVINGLFILFEDSLSVGDIVTLRGISGLVEKVTLRAVTVRDLEGNVHVIPNSTLDLITNMTKEFSRHVIDVGVAYREDVDRVMEILKEVGEDLQNDPTFGWDMMRPLEIMGLHDFADSAVVIRTRLWTLPGQQFRLGREFRRRLKRVFDERGVEIPFPHRTLYWGMPKEGPQPPIPIAFDSPSAQRADNGRSRPSEPAPPPGVED